MSRPVRVRVGGRCEATPLPGLRLELAITLLYGTGLPVHLVIELDHAQAGQLVGQIEGTVLAAAGCTPAEAEEITATGSLVQRIAAVRERRRADGTEGKP